MVGATVVSDGDATGARSGERAFFAPVAGGVAATLGAMGIIGWIFGIDVLTSLIPGHVAMNPSTALCFILVGLGLAFWGSGSLARAWARFSSAVVVIIGLTRLGEYASWWDTGVDTWFLGQRVLAAGNAQVAPLTALGFVLVGLAFLRPTTHTSRPTLIAYQLLLVSSVLGALSALVGHLYRVPVMHGPMALSTALGFFILAIGGLGLTPDRGLTAVFVSPGMAAPLVRRVVPVVIGLSLIIGWLQVAGLRRGLFEPEVGASFFILTIIVALATILLTTARSFELADSQRLEAERALRRSEERYRLLFETIPLATWVYDRKTLAFMAVNRTAVSAYGYSRSEFLAMTMKGVLPEEDVPAVLYRMAHDDSGQLSVRTWRHQKKDGSLLDVEVTSHPLVLADRPATLVLVRDISEEKRSAEQLQRYAAELEAANAELDAFCYSVSHDLRAPLRSIDGFSQAILEDCGEQLDDEGQGHLERVRAAAQRMAQLIDDLLDLSRVSRVGMRRQSVDLSALAEDVLEKLRHNDPQRRVTTVVAPGLRVEGDSRLLRVMLENLFDNAWKYSRPKTEACIELGHAVVNGKRPYYVRDDGVGFEMAYVEKLFTPFQRLHSAVNFEGTGIGLATVQRIVNRHGGSIWAEGEVGRGATFFFTLRKEAEGKK